MASKRKEGSRTNKLPKETPLPTHRLMLRSDDRTAEQLDPNAEDFPSPQDERYINTITGVVESTATADLETRLKESTAVFTEALGAMEERNASMMKTTEESARQRDSVLSKLLEQLVLSNKNVTEQANRAEKNRLDFEKKQRDENRERYEKEKEERTRKEALKAIPAPTPMSKDQDIADYLELFETNMECRQIPQAARASHLVPLLNSKSLVAISGLPPEAKLDMAVLKKTLLATANTSTRYASKAYWDFTKKSGDSFLAMGTQMMKLARRFATADSIDEVLEKFTIENMLQKMPVEMQQYCREKESASIEHLAGVAGKYCALKGLDELKMDASKPWTLKPKEEKVEEKKRSWEEKRNVWHGKSLHKKPFKQWDTRQIGDSSTSQTEDKKHVTSQQLKQEDKPLSGSNSFMASKKCYFCGDYGHFSRNCPKRKQVNVAQVPSLCKVKDRALTIPGKIGHTQVPDMLCDSGATISVIANHLVPPETKLQEKVWIETLDGPAKPYPTALVATEVNNKTIELFAAILPAEAMPYPVILGRYIPGMTVTWSMTVGNDNETIFQLEQDTCSSKAPPLAKKSIRKKKFKQMLDSLDLPGKEAVAGEPTSQVVEERADTVPPRSSGEIPQLAKKSIRKKKYKQMLDTAAEVAATKQSEKEAVAGDPTSQVVEEKADTVPLSRTNETAPLANKSTRKSKFRKTLRFTLPEEETVSNFPLSKYDKEIWPGKGKHPGSSAAARLTPLQLAEPGSLAPCVEVETSSIEVFPVITRAQSKKKIKEVEAHELATAQSQVIITPPQLEPVTKQGRDVSDVFEDAATEEPQSRRELLW